MFIHKNIYDMAEEKRSVQENEFEESQTNEVENECVNTEKHQEEVHKKKEDKACKKEDKQLEELGQKLIEMNDKYLRLSAEFDNYRKRTLKEKMELTKSAGEQLLQNILPVVDNFERALKSMNTAKDVTSLKEGVDLIYANFKTFLTQNGVKEIETENADFDTDIHEAVTTIPAPTPELKGKVLDCVEKGYYLNDKVMRFAKVVVGE